MNKCTRYASNGAESELFNKLYSITNNEIEADNLYAYFRIKDGMMNPEFRDIFGDFSKIKDITTAGEYWLKRLDENLEPILTLDSNLGKYYFLDKDNERVYYPYTVQGIRKLFPTKERNAFVNTLARKFFMNNQNEDFENIELISDENLDKWIESFILEKIESLKHSGTMGKIIASRLQRSLPYVNEWRDEVLSFYQSIKLNYEIETEAEALRSEEENERGSLFTKESFLSNQKNNASTKVKLYLSLLHEDKLNIFDEFEFINFNKIWSLLNRELEGIVPTKYEGELQDIYDLFIDKIKDVSELHPFLKPLLDRNNTFNLITASENFKTEFVTALFLNKNNFLQTEYEFTEDGKVNVKVFNVSEVGGQANNILNKFKFNLNKKDKPVLDIESKLKKLKTEWVISSKKLTEDNQIEQLKPILKLFNDVLNSFGVEVSPEAIPFFIDELQHKETSLSKKEKKINKTIEQLGRALDFIKDSKNNKEDVFKFQSIFKELAKAESYFKGEMSDAVVFSAGKNKWIYSLYSYVDLQVAQWKSNPEQLWDFYNENETNRSSSHYLFYLLALDLVEQSERGTEKHFDLIKERVSSMEVAIMNSIQVAEKSVEAVDRSEMSYTDSLADLINKSLMFKINNKVYNKSGLAGDKNTERQISYGNVAVSTNVKLNNDGTFSINNYSEVIPILERYFESEYNRMIQVWKDIETKNEEELILHYHLGNQNGKKSQIFPSLSPTFNKEGKAEVPQGLEGIYNRNGKPRYKNFQAIPIKDRNFITSKIESFISNGILRTYQELVTEEIIKFDKKGNKINNGIDESIFNSYKEGETIGNGIYSLVGDVFINGIISQVEYTKMFTGDPAFYKDMKDYRKRVSETYTDGKYPRVTEGNEWFNVSVIDSVEGSVNNMEAFINSFKDPSKRELARKAYSEVNKADAQAWITPERWKFLMQSIGKFDKHAQSAFDKMFQEKPEFTKDEKKRLAQPLKGVYYNLTGVPTYLKYSQAVLLPNLIKGTHLETLYNKMTKDENGKELPYNEQIHELLTKDAIKVGSLKPVKAEENNNIVNDIQLNSIKLNNTYWKLQQDLPVKGLKEIPVGSQIQKNIFQGLAWNLTNEDGSVNTFDVAGEELTTEQVIERIHEVMSAMSNKGLKNFFRRIGITPDDFEIKDDRKLYDSLIKQLKLRQDTPKNLLKALQAGISPYGIPGSFEMIQNVFSSMLNDEVIDIKTNGGGFIQMSDWGISYENQKDHNILFTPWHESKLLEAPEIRTDEKTGKKYIKPGGVFISGSLIAKYIPNYTKYNPKQLFGTLNEETGKYEGGIIDQDILRNIIGYRIPNQGLGSNDALEVMGILPEETGDTIIAYTGITTKTGSDFDIDKMYIMFPSLKVHYENAYDILKKFYTGNTIQESIDLLSDLLDEFEIENNMTNEDIIRHMFSDNHQDLINISREFYSEAISKIIKNNEISEKFLEKHKDDLEVTRLEYYKENKEYSNFEEMPIEVLQNKLIELYKGVLTSPLVFDQLMTPLDGSLVSDDVNIMFPEEDRGDLFEFDTIEDLKLKFQFMQGKAGLGQNVNSLTDAVKGALANTSIYGITLFRGNKNENGEPLFDKQFSETLSDKEIKDYIRYNHRKETGKEISTAKLGEEVKNFKKQGLDKIELFFTMNNLINAFVDIAKDPFITRANWNTRTNDIGFLMLRSGIHPYYVNSFLGQPILRDYVNFVFNQESKIINSQENVDTLFLIKRMKNQLQENLKSLENINNVKVINNEVIVDYIFKNDIQTARIPINTLFDELFSYKTVSNLGVYQDANTLKNSFSIAKFEEDFNKLEKANRVKISKLFNHNNEELEDAIINEINSVFVDNLLPFKNDDLTIDPNKIDLGTLKDQLDNPSNEVQLGILKMFKNYTEYSKELTKNIRALKTDVDGKGKNIVSTLVYKNTFKSLLDNSGLEKKFANFHSKLFYNDKPTFANTYKTNSIDVVMDIMKANPKFFMEASNMVENSFNVVSKLLYKEILTNSKLGEKLSKAYTAYIMSNFKPLQLSNEDKSKLVNELPEEFLAKQVKYPNNYLLQKLFIDVKQGISYISMPNLKMQSIEKDTLTDSWLELMKEEPEFSNKLVQYSYLISGFNNAINQFHQFIPYEWFNQNRFNSYIKNLNINQSIIDEKFIDQFFRNNTDDSTIVKKHYFLNDRNRFGKTPLEIAFKHPITSYLLHNGEGGYFKLYKRINENVGVYVRTTKLGYNNKKGNKFVEYSSNNEKLDDFKSIFKVNQFESKALDNIIHYLNSDFNGYSAFGVISNDEIVDNFVVTNPFKENTNIDLANNKAVETRNIMDNIDLGRATTLTMSPQEFKEIYTKEGTYLTSNSSKFVNLSNPISIKMYGNEIKNVETGEVIDKDTLAQQLGYDNWKSFTLRGVEISHKLLKAGGEVMLLDVSSFKPQMVEVNENISDDNLTEFNKQQLDLFKEGIDPFNEQPNSNEQNNCK